MGRSPPCNSLARSKSRCTAARSKAAPCARIRTSAAATNPAKYSTIISSALVKVGRPMGFRNSITPTHSPPSKRGEASKAFVFHPVFSSAFE